MTSQKRHLVDLKTRSDVKQVKLSNGKENLDFLPLTQAKYFSSQSLRESSLNPQEIIFIDLETGDFMPDFSDILEIAAYFKDQSFTIYVTPTTEINPKASKKTQLRFQNGILKFKGKAVESYSIKESLMSFIFWLKSIQARVGNKLLLAAHNAPFDACFLLYYLKEQNLELEFSQVVGGFLDTYSVVRTGFPNLTYYNLDHMVRLMLPMDRQGHEPHTAKSDALFLQKVFYSELVHRISYLEQHCMSMSAALNLCRRQSSFKQLVIAKVLPQFFATKLARAGYDLHFLNETYLISGQAAIVEIFLEKKPNGQATICWRPMRMISKVISFLAQNT